MLKIINTDINLKRKMAFALCQQLHAQSDVLTCPGHVSMAQYVFARNSLIGQSDSLTVDKVRGVNTEYIK